MGTHASRNTTTGSLFEERVKIINCGINLQKHKLYSYLSQKGINWKTLLSRQLLPDECFFNEDTGEFIIYEKKYQETQGTADEKPQTCAFKIQQYKKIGAAIGATDVKYIYIFNDWFKQDIYKDMLDYIKTVDGCDYIFADEIN